MPAHPVSGCYRLSILSKERIAEELNKMLVTERPSMAFRLMDETGLLERVLPQLSALKGVETIEGRGHKENFSHTLAVLDNVAAAEREGIAAGRLKDFTPEQRRVRNEYRQKMANRKSSKEVDNALEQMKQAFIEWK